jgi:hypothetical protein
LIKLSKVFNAISIAVLRTLGARAKKNLGALSMNIKKKLFYMFLNLLLDLGFSKDLDHLGAQEKIGGPLLGPHLERGPG